jgi:hypothetical protein
VLSNEFVAGEAGPATHGDRKFLTPWQIETGARM